LATPSKNLAWHLAGLETAESFSEDFARLLAGEGGGSDLRRWSPRVLHARALETSTFEIFQRRCLEI